MAEIQIAQIIRRLYAAEPTTEHKDRETERMTSRSLHLNKADPHTREILSSKGFVEVARYSKGNMVRT